MLLDKTAEEGRVGKVELHGNFLHGLVGLCQTLGDNVDDIVLDPMCRSLSAHFAYHHREVFGRDVQQLKVE